MKEEIQSKYNIVRDNLVNAQDCLGYAVDDLSDGLVIDSNLYKVSELNDKISQISDIEDDVFGRIFPAISNM